ncbi:MAG: c-type cytochrome [Polyangiaceae bacterium]
MSSNTPWMPNEENAQDVYAFLLSLEGGAGEGLRRSIPLTMPRDIVDLPAGRSADGRGVYDRACKACHGEAHSGSARIRAGLPILPEETVDKHAYLNSRDATRLVFIEKTRHGGFFGYGGSMPPFALEVLPNSDLAALLAFLGLY